MPNQTAKSHKSRKTGDEPGKPRQRNLPAGATTMPVVVPVPASGSSPVESPSSLVPATTASVSSDIPKEGAIEPNSGAPAPLPKEQQPWYRPPDSKARKMAEKIAVLRAAGHKGPAIAKKLKTTEGNVRYVEYIARKNGWYDEDDQPIDLEVEMALTVDRKIVRNIDASLDGQMTNWQTHEMTIAAAKGRRIFKSEDGQAQTAQMQVVAIRIEMPPLGTDDQKIVEENVGGVPAYIEGDILEMSNAGNSSDDARI